MYVAQNGSSKDSRMKNLYYISWVDSIERFKRYNSRRKDWRWATFTMNTFVQSVNLWVVMLWLKYFEIFSIRTIEVNFFPGYMVDGFVNH